MSSVVGLMLLRLPVASALVFAGLAKLVRYPDSAAGNWRPEAISSRFWKLIVLGMALLELALATVVMLGGQSLVILSTVGAMSVLTAYGIISTRRTGRCGCWGESVPIGARRLTARNGLLTAGACAGAIALPSVGVGTIESAGPVAGFAPAVTLMVIGVVAISLRARSARLP